MRSRIDIQYKIEDSRAEVYKKKFKELDISGDLKGVQIVNSYSTNASLSKSELAKIIKTLTNPVIESGDVHPSAVAAFDWVIEIGYLPGVTDNVGNTARETIEDSLKKKFKTTEKVYSSNLFYLRGRLSESDIKIIAGSLYNPLIQNAKIKTSSQFKKEKGMGAWLPEVKLDAPAKVLNVDLNISDEELATIGKKGIVGPDGESRGPLALDLDYMKAIAAYFKDYGRAPTDIELESIAQTWSEHCKHTIFADPIDEVEKGLYRTYIKGATNEIRKKMGKKDFCASVFTDNAGAIFFDDKYLVTHKVETHNSPSALDPFGGAITGIVGVNRDAIGFGMGAKPVANLYGYCLANPEDDQPLYRDKGKTQMMLSPRRIMDGVIAGVNVGGNCSGIPTVSGFVYFNDRFRGKPLVFVGTVGLIPRKTRGRSATEKEARNGDYIVMMGGRVGRDGIHGATFSSEGMTAGSPATAVQIGDPITQKKLSDAVVKEARDLGLYTSITDDGAGGLSCSVAEMAKECGGAEVEMEKIPLKYPGLEPWQIWISESQERMTLSVPKTKWKQFKKLMDSRGVEATVIGKFTNSGRCVVKQNGKKIMDLEMEFLHNGLPKRKLKTAKPSLRKTGAAGPLPLSKNLAVDLAKLLGRLNIAGYEFISSQYDHEVQASSVIKPLQGRGRVNADAAVFRPVLDSKKGVVVSAALNPTYTEIDPYAMAAATIDEAIRINVAAGGDLKKLALLDNFCWCSSNEPERLWQLKEAVRACYDTALVFNTPFISGKDSMFNDFKGFDEGGNAIKISVPPTLLISTISVLDDATKAISIDFKFNGDLIYLLGETESELGGSEYLSMIQNAEDQNEGMPQVNAEENYKTYQAFSRAAQKGLIASAASVGRGGLAVTLAKSAMAGKLGAEISLKGAMKDMEAGAFLFSEGAGRLLVSIAPKNRQAFEKIMKGSEFARIGEVKGQSIKIKDAANKMIVNLPVVNALKKYKLTFANF